jgi:phage protein D
VHSQQEADQLAERALAEMALRYIRAEGQCIGDPRLRAGKVVKIEGLGERFSGPYYVTSVEHRFGRSGGYRTSFSARRNSA